MRARRLVAEAAGCIAAAAGLVVVVHDAPAVAQVANGGEADGAIQADASDPGDAPPRADPVSTKSRGGGGPRPTCTAANGAVGPVNYRPVPSDQLLQDERDKIAREGGGYYLKFCGSELAPKSFAGTGLDSVYRPAGAPGAPAVDPAELAADALQRTPLPEPRISMSPSPDIPQLVNLTSFLWLPAEQWQPVTASASAGGVTSTVTATPMRVIWNMGQGDTVTCDGPGVPYQRGVPDDQQPSSCHYTYRRSSAGQPGQSFTVTATIEWKATWTASGAAGGGDLGTVSRSSSTPIQVAEIQTINTPISG